MADQDAQNNLPPPSQAAPQPDPSKSIDAIIAAAKQSGQASVSAPVAPAVNVVAPQVKEDAPKRRSIFGPRLSKEEIAKQRETEYKRKEAIKREEEAKKTYEKGLASIRDLIAPSSIQTTPNYIKLNEYYVRTIFVFDFFIRLFNNL